MTEYKVTVSERKIVWKLNGLTHSNGDLPAIEWLEGTIISKEWHQNGKRHCVGGPAVVYMDGTKEWFQFGIRHNEDGPAVEYTDGPVVNHPNGTKKWFIGGKELTEQEFNNRNNVELTLQEIADKFNISIDNLKIKK